MICSPDRTSQISSPIRVIELPSLENAIFPDMLLEIESSPYCYSKRIFVEEVSGH